jgi:hypothetical protein
MMDLCVLCGYYMRSGDQCRAAPAGPDHKAQADARISAIEMAYADMKRRGWGFTSTGEGFGDPSSMMTAVGPYDGTLVEVLGADADPVEAVKKAIAKADHAGS